jgi:hypothetical protein
VVRNRQILAPIRWTDFTRVPKNKAKPDSIRWRYLFETAQHAFSKIRFDADALQKLAKTCASLPVNYDLRDSDVGKRVNPISASDLPRESQKAAIQQTLDVLKRKERNCDAILDYLKYELYGRRIRQNEHDLTTYQHELVSKLIDIADLFEYVHAKIDGLGEDLEEQEAQLESDRDNVIRLIQKELDQPIIAANIPESPGSAKPKIPDAPAESKEHRGDVAAEKIMEDVRSIQELTGMNFHDAHNFLKESSWNLEAAISRYLDEQNKPNEFQDHSAESPEQLMIIQRFRELTSTNFDDALNFLEGVSWNLDAALTAYYDEEEAANESASINDKLSPEQSHAITKFIQATGVEYEAADSYLLAADWKTDTAVSKFHADRAATETTGLPSMFSSQTAAIKDRPTNHVAVGFDSNKRQAVSSPEWQLIVTLDETAQQKEDLPKIEEELRRVLKGLKQVHMHPHPDTDSKAEDVNEQKPNTTGANEVSKAHTFDAGSTVPTVLCNNEAGGETKPAIVVDGEAEDAKQTRADGSNDAKSDAIEDGRPEYTEESQVYTVAQTSVVCQENGKEVGVRGLLYLYYY